MKLTTSHPSRQQARQGGFTILEILIVVAVSVPALLAVLSTGNTVTRTTHKSDKAAETAMSLRKLSNRLERLLRSAERSTIEVRATQADVDGKKAEHVGEWIPAVDNDARSNLRFRSKSGVLSMNASKLTSYRELEFQLDPAETSNGIDDDGDGLIDEGAIFMKYGGIRPAIASNVESCSFTVDGEAVRFSMSAVRRDREKTIYRRSTSRVVWIRNR